MTDTGGLAALGVSVPLALRVLGPTADYLGDELQQWTEHRLANVQRIFDNAGRRLGEEGLDRPGRVPPRVLKEILDQGSYCENELAAEYFGGILASSRSELAHDDRDASLAALVGRLSSYQVRCHYLFYMHARQLLVGANVNLSELEDRRQHGSLFLPRSSWFEGMEFDADELERWFEIAAHCMTGLTRENLIAGDFSYGDEERFPDYLSRHLDKVTSGLIFRVTVPGMELFARAHAVKGVPADALCSPAAQFETDVSIQLGAPASKVRNGPRILPDEANRP
jgi:hypothetical protein